MERISYYDQLRAVPEEAKKPIGAGRLKGMTDINPMWRIKRLDELFGMCGFGWKYVIVDRWTESSMETSEIAAFVIIDLFVKVGDAWSEAIPGTGGSTFVASEKSGLHMSDECYKMALTDAISVACKAIGMAADIYYAKDRTKYTESVQDDPPAPPAIICRECGREIRAVRKPDGTVVQAETVAASCGGLCPTCYKSRRAVPSGQPVA